VLQLVEEGRLALEDTVGLRLPGVFPENKRRITIRQLLSHASGLEDVFNTVPQGFAADPQSFLAELADPGLRRRVAAAAARLRADHEATLPPHLCCGMGYGHDGGFGFASWARANADGTKVAVLVVNGRGRDTGIDAVDILDDLVCSP
jgi:CubicO group peptidase (beta-lactamase class C family)